MNTQSEFSWLEAKDFASKIVFSNTGKHLSDIEILVLQGAWEGKTYDDIAKIHGYSSGYINKDVGQKLWDKLSEVLPEKVTKKNFQEALKRANKQQRAKLDRTVDFTFPEGSVSINSPLYVERYGVENLCYETVVKPGSLIRIKAPELMGKTSLMNRILNYAEQQNYHTVYLDLKSVDKKILTNLEKFLRWLCCMVGRQLNLEGKLNDYWDTEILGSNDNCTVYFEEYLLSEINCPIVLGLDEVDRLFPYTEVVEDFFGMLRSWHEKGKISRIWEQLRLVIAHSTEVYIPLDINQSPFNAGIPIELREFNAKQIKDLAELHDLNWNDTQVNDLMNMVGGHPYLIRLAMYEVGSQKVTVEQLLQNASTEAGIYSNHLRRYLEVLQKNPELGQAVKDIVISPEPVELDSRQIYKLHSMGLVQRQNNHVTPRCNLYRQYFQRVL